jgi:hypothetical protein
MPSPAGENAPERELWAAYGADRGQPSIDYVALQESDAPDIGSVQKSCRNS